MARLGGSTAEGLLASSLLVTTLILLVNVSLAEEILLTVNVKKALALTSDKFLSYTLDPTAVLNAAALTKNPEKSINMARVLSPAYVRIAGPRSNSYTFGRHQSENNEDNNFTFTETNWIDVHRWAENAGLDLLVCIAPQYTEIGGGDSVWDSRNALDLISFSDRMGFNTSWQLGYECQTRCDITGIEGGKAVTRLRNMLNAFPRYARSIVTGPDVVAFRTRQQQQYIQDYLNVAGNSLSAITWHPNFSGVSLDTESVSMHQDDLAIDRDSLYRSIGRPIWKKPLWLAESKPEECKNQFLGALVWTRRLGNAAKLGVQVIMRQPDGSDLLQPTPDYWVSVLHKTLVGHEVFDTRITNGNRSHVNFYCQCTRPSSKYVKGSLTIFGINLTPSKIYVNLRGLKNKTTHKYILMPGYDTENRMFSKTVLLNDEPLNLVNDRELPEIRPAVSSNSRGVVLTLPSGGIGFWVLPGLKIKSCGGSEGGNADRTQSKRSSKRLDLSESTEDDAESEESNNDNSSPEKRRHPSNYLKNRKRSYHRYSNEEDVESNADDTFLDQLLKSKKIKRTGVAERIDDQLRVIRQMLAEENERRQRNGTEAVGSDENPDGVGASPMTSSEGNLPRRRRQSDKRFGVDPLGLRKEGMYRRLGRISEDTKERRNRRKDRDDRKEVQSSMLDWKTDVDSEENDFYGFHKSAPIKNFPEGDVHLNVGNSEEETASDRTYAKNGDQGEARKVKRVTKTSRRSGRAMVEAGKDDDERIEARDKQSTHIPKEFFENVRMADTPCVRKDSKDHRELGEAESISQNHGNPSNAEIDEVATVKKIVPERHHDDQEDERAKESTLEKLIGYYEEPRAQMDESTEYESTEDATPSSGTMTNDDAPSSKISQALFHAMNPAIKKKRVKNLASGESASLMDFRSMHFGKPTVSSVEEQAFSNYDGEEKVTGKSAKRTKRSAYEVLENVLDREMIFQDDYNLKDCDCRVTRGARILTDRGETGTEKLRNTRLKKPLGMARQRVTKLSERRKNRKRKGTATQKPLDALDGNHSQTLRRPKRRAELPDERVIGLVTEDPGLAYSDGRDKVTSTPEETVLQELPRATMNYKIPSFEEYSGPDSNRLTKIDAKDTSGHEKEDSAVKSLALDEEMINVAIETEAAATSLVKRHDKEAMSQNEGTLIGDPESEITSGTVLSSSSKGSSTAAEDTLESTKGSNLQFFRSRKNKKEITRKLNQAKEAKQANRSDTTLLPSVEVTEAPSFESSRMPVPRATVKIAATPASPFVVPDEVTEEATAKNEEATAEAAKTSMSGKKVRRKTPTVTSKAAPSISDKVKASRSTKTEAAALRRKSARTQSTVKPSDPVGPRKTTPSPDGAASKRSEERKARKSKRTEQLERLQKRLRQKKEKLMNDYREELLSDLEGSNDGGKNLHRRETVDMTTNEMERCALVDGDKYEYLKRNKPIDYEATENPDGLRDAGVTGEKYIPKAVEIARSFHVTRERRVKPRNEISRATRASKSLNSSEEASNAEQMMERLEDDATEHKIDRRAGKTYYSPAGSVEDPRTLEALSYDEDFDERPSRESDDVELDEALMDSSFVNDDRKFTHHHREDSEDYHTILDWDNEETQRLKRPQHFGSSLKTFGHGDYALLEDTSEDPSTESSEERLEFVNEDGHSNFASMDDEAVDEREHEMKGRRLTKSKQGRLAVGRSEFLRDESPEDQSSSSEFDSGETLNEHESKLTRRKMAKNDAEKDSWIAERTRESSEARYSAVMDYTDLDDMLNSGKYELLMLVPVNKHRKSSRQRRHVGNEITRDQGHPIGNSITIEMMPKSINVEEVKARIPDNHISIFRTNDAHGIPTSLLDTLANKENDGRATSESPTNEIVEGPKTLEKEDQKALNEYVIEEELRSVPKIASDYRGESKNDGGLADLIEGAIPKLEATVTGGLDKVRGISESFEKFIDDFDDRFDQKPSERTIDRHSSRHNEENDFPISSDAYDGAFTSIKKIFDFLSGLVHTFRND